MKKVVVIISVIALVFLGLPSGAFSQRHSGGGGHGGGYSAGVSRGGAYPTVAYRGGGHHSGGYYGGGHYYRGGGSNFYFGGVFGFPWFPYYGYSYGYPYSYPYSYPYAYPSAYQNYPYVVNDYPYAFDQPTAYSETEQPSYWYYCRDPEGYYPYVTRCPSGWAKVAPTPPRAEGGA
jgi:hypothetical protein